MGESGIGMVPASFTVSVEFLCCWAEVKPKLVNVCSAESIKSNQGKRRRT
jgi:hypothetical protein